METLERRGPPLWTGLLGTTRSSSRKHQKDKQQLEIDKGPKKRGSLVIWTGVPAVPSRERLLSLSKYIPRSWVGKPWGERLLTNRKASKPYCTPFPCNPRQGPHWVTVNRQKLKPMFQMTKSRKQTNNQKTERDREKRKPKQKPRYRGKIKVNQWNLNIS